MTYLVVPQWQGSGSSRAMRLIDGANTIGAELPSSALRVRQPSGAGSSLDSGISRLSSIQYVRDEMLAALKDSEETTVTIGGDCGVELAAVQHAGTKHDFVLVWFDAHGDLNTPASSHSGSFGGMVLRTLLGDAPESIRPPQVLSANRVILAGVRALDESESGYITTSGITHLTPEILSPETLAAAIAASGASSVYLHIDLDVLDPAEFACVGSAEPFGLSLAELLALIAAARAQLPVAGVGITGFAPPTPDAAADDLTSILRIIAAVSKKL